MHCETAVTQVTYLSEGLPELLPIMAYLMLTMMPHFLYLPVGPYSAAQCVLSSLFPHATSLCIGDRAQSVSLNILIFTFSYAF